VTRHPGVDTLDLAIRSGTAALIATGSIADDGDVVLTGQLSGIEIGAPTSPVRLVLDSSDAATLDAQEVEPGTVALSSAQGEVPYRIVRYMTTSAVGERYEIHSGSLEDVEGNIRFDFVAVSDPIHIPVIGALLVVAVCPMLVGVAFLSEWVQARTSGWRAACLDDGNFPFVVPVFRYKVRLWRGEADCEAKARLECRDRSGRVVSSNETGFEPLAE
jgi:hypothetical protein